METQNQETDYLKAKKRVAEIKKFYSSLMFYFVFIAFLGGLNYYLNEWSHPWFLWAALGWGIGLFFQATHAFKWSFLFGKDWEERKLKKYLEEEKNKSNSTRL